METSPSEDRDRAVGSRLLAPAAIVLGFGIAGVLLWVAAPSGTAWIALPALATLCVLVTFTLLLERRVGANLVGEIGFMYVGLAVAYTVLPALAFLAVETDAVSGWGKLATLLPTPAETGRHLARHALFVFGVAAGYLLGRGKRVPTWPAATAARGERGTILFLAGLIVVCAFSVSALSAPVTSYVEHYTRFEHLSWLPLHIAYVALLLKAGSYYVLMLLLFRDFRRHRILTIAAVVAICAYEITYSYGARLESLGILLGAVCAYHLEVRPITLRLGAAAAIAILVLFSGVELLRTAEGDITAAQDAASDQGAMPASELGAVFFTGYHLYSERANGSLPPREWPMFFNDIIQLVPFVDHTRWHPEYWYARNYFPDALVPPETLGPIAESAVWGGEVDLLLRAVVNGLFFAWLTRWYLRRRSTWWAGVVYAYVYATCVISLKYSVLYHLQPIFRVLVPTILVVALVRRRMGVGSAPLRSGGVG